MFGQKSIAPPRPRALAPVHALRADDAATPTPSDDVDPAAPREILHALLANLSAAAVSVRTVAPGRVTRLYARGRLADNRGAERPSSHAPARYAGTGVDIRWTVDGDGIGALLTAGLGTARLEVAAAFHGATPFMQRKADAELRRIAPALIAAVEMWSQAGRDLVQLQRMTAAVDLSGTATMLIDKAGNVVFSNRAALALLDRGDGLKHRGSAPGCVRLADTLHLRTAIEHVISGAGAGAARATAPVVAIQRDQRRPLLAVVVGAECTEAADACAAVMYVFDPEDGSDALLGPTCRHYKLSPAETRLTCLLSQGDSIAAASQKLRIREDTARSYLKQIFLKTDTCRQAQLVWLMLKSSVRTATSVTVA